MKIKKIAAAVSICVLVSGIMPYNNFILSAAGESVEDTTAAENYSTGTYESLTYKKYSDHIEISDCDTSVTSVVIPDEIEGLPVTVVGGFSDCTEMKSINLPESIVSISEKAFLGCLSLESITIPESVKNIGGKAFWHCVSLTEIIIPDGIVSIENQTFDWCESLEKISIPDSVENIGKYAFHWCESLKEITIPESVVSIGENAFFGTGLEEITILDNVSEIGAGAFADCKSLKKIIVAENNNLYCSADGVLFDKKMSRIISCPSAKSGEYVIPDTVTEIANYAFYECEYLTGITFGSNIKSIGKYSFDKCISLKEIILPESVKVVDNSAFVKCSALEKVIVSQNVASIGSAAFMNCTNLNEIEILNPDCKIDESKGTISNVSDKQEGVFYNGIIYGYDNSTAESYAEICGYNFVSLGEAPFRHNLRGDVNLDGEITIADVVTITAYVGNPEKNSLDQQSITNGDVHSAGDGLTANDALAIQQYLANIISSFD